MTLHIPLHIRASMSVLDSGGAHIGTVVRVYWDLAAAGSVFAVEWQTNSLCCGLVEVDATPVGLDRPLFIPMDAIRHIGPDALLLLETIEALREARWHGWDRRPANLDRLRRVD